VTLQGGHVAASGAGLYAYATENSHIISKISTVRGVKATTGSGGGIYNYAKIATITMNNSTIDNAQAGLHGGGIYNYSTNGDAVLSLAGTNVLLNSANLDGGGIYNVSDTGASRITLNSTINNADENYLIKHSIVSGNISQEGSGAGIYSRGLTSNLNIKDSWIYSNATYGTESSGGGIYSTAVSSSVVTVENSNIFKNVTSGFNDYGAGSAIYSYSENNEGASESLVTIINSTIASNTATNAAIYSYSLSNYYNATNNTSKSIVNVINSTITGNISNDKVGGIYVYADSFTKENAQVAVSLLNSIVFANYLATNASDVVLAGTENQDFNVVYSIFGQSTINPTASLEEVRLIANETSIKRIFSNANRDTEQRWIPVVDQDGFATIRHTGEAAIEGTLTAKVGNAFYYYDMSSTKWRSFDHATVYNFVDDADNNYGLPVNANTIVYTIAANADANKNFASRVPTLYYFNVGAYALHGGTYQDASLVVTTNKDGINIFDNYTTLREALVFATNRVGAVFENGKESYTITFADTPDVWTGGTSCTITLTKNYEELRITNGLSGKSLTIDPGMSPQNPDIPRYVTINVENPGLIMINNLWQENENADKFRVFQIGTSYDVTSDWNINFLRTTLIGGKILSTDSAGSVLEKDQIGNGGVVL
jgi:hypothetical protein